jgi:outer membrane protein TolC
MARGTKTGNTTPTVRPKRTRRAIDSTQTQITEQDISRRAYQIYESRRGNGGSPLEDWLEAERQLRSTTTH